MGSVLASSVVDHGLQSWSRQTKDVNKNSNIEFSVHE